MAASAGTTRSALLKRAAGAGGAALAVGATAGWLVAPAAAAPIEMDLAWVRFGIAAEFVSAEYYRRARRSGLFSPAESRTLERATAAQNAHRRRLRDALMQAGQAPVDDADLEVVLPDAAFDDRQRAVSLGRRIEALLVHAYLGAIVVVQDQTIRELFAQISASESEQLTFLKGLTGPVATDSFPSVHGLATAADELARYLP